jgi:hypothetical protein
MRLHNFNPATPVMRQQLIHAGIFVCLAASISGCSQPRDGGSQAVLGSTPSTVPTASPAIQTTTTALLPTPEETHTREFTWVVNAADKSLVRIDAETNLVAGSLKTDGVPLEVASGPAGVFAISQQTDTQADILKIDPQTNRVEDTLPLQFEGLQGLAVSSDAIWAVAVPLNENGAIPETQSTEAAGELIRIDPLTFTVTALLPLSSAPRQLIFQEDALWILEDTGMASRFTRFDPASQQSSTIPVSQLGMNYVYQLNRFASSGPWMWGISILSVSRYIYRIDSSDGRLDKTIEIGSNPDDNPVDITAVDESVWVAVRSGSVVEVDAETGEIIQRIPLNFTPERIFSEMGSIWAEGRSSATLTRIDPNTGSIQAEIITGGMLQPTSTPWPRLAPGEICQGNYPTTLALYGHATVSPDPPLPNRVRSEPNLKAEVLGELQPGQGMSIIEGPVCTDGWIWWKIMADDHKLTGWTAEGDGDMYWLIPN